jgi:hypothetical protein
MEATKGFLADFIEKKIKLHRLSLHGNGRLDGNDYMSSARYESALSCLMKNSRQDLAEIIRLSPPHMNERQATEEFLKNVSSAADEFASEFAQGVLALAKIIIWENNKSLEKFPEHFIPELDSAIKEIFPDSALWGNIAWDAIVKKTEKFLAGNYQDSVTLAVYSRAVTILSDHDNRVVRLYFESFRNDVIKAIVLNIVQPMAMNLTSATQLDEAQREMLLGQLSLLQASILAA